MNIEVITTSSAITGMLVAEDIYSINDQLLVGKNTILSDRSIIRLKMYGIKEFSIITENENLNTIDESNQEKMKQKDVSNIRESAYYTRVRNTKEFIQFKKNFEKSVDAIQSSFSKIMDDGQKDIDSDSLLLEFEIIMEESRNGIHVIDMLNCMRVYDDSTYVHSLNVSLISSVLGKWLNLSKSDIRVLSLCGMLHDIGKLSIPQEIILKPGKLTDDEYKIIKEHPILGYNILKEKNIDPRIKLTALMHHEKCDATGYPGGLAQPQIDFFAKIVSIADVYDAMTSKRVYRGPICPFEVISIFELEGLHMFDPHCLLVFLERTVAAYINNRVLLSNKIEAEIIMINKLALSKPVVRTTTGRFIDLSIEHDIIIEAII